MSLLSLTALSRLAERNVRTARRPVAPGDLIDMLGEQHAVHEQRAADAVRLAVDRGRLVPTPDGLALPALEQLSLTDEPPAGGYLLRVRGDGARSPSPLRLGGEQSRPSTPDETRTDDPD